MNKFRLLTILISLMTIFSVSNAFADNLMLEYDGGVYQYDGAVYKLMVNNKTVKSALDPIVFNDRALVPVREVFEEVGATVRYNVNTQTVEVVDDNAYIRMKINDNTAYVNGSKTSIPDSVVPKLISKVGGETKTMVPVRFISEAIGLNVDFDAENGAILIDSEQYIENAPTAKPRPTPVETARPAGTIIQKPSEWISEAPQVTQAPTEAPKVNISKISYKNVETGKIAVTVEMNGEAKYSYFTLDNPERLVVDIQDTLYNNGENTMYVNNGGISAVRIGVNQERTRIVVDMSKIINYGFGKDGNNLIIYVKASEPVATATATPRPTSVPTAAPSQNKEVKYNKNVVVIDAGHGGYDPGAQGVLNGKTVNESTLTLQISNKVKNILENNGYKVIMTRTDDTYKTLIERPQLANQNEAAVFVSIHINSVDNAPSANGTEVFYAESNNESVGGVTSSMLANNILNSMLSNMGSYNRGVKTAEHAVTKRSNMPACLAEVGFITNPTEVANMSSSEYQDKVARGIAEGIMKTIKIMK